MAARRLSAPLGLALHLLEQPVGKLQIGMAIANVGFAGLDPSILWSSAPKKSNGDVHKKGRRGTQLGLPLVPAKSGKNISSLRPFDQARPET